jgi:hypothetical protein
MTRLSRTALAAAVTGGLLLTSPAVVGQGPLAPNPAAIVQRCIASITFTASYCIAVNEKDAADCVIRITDLLARGQKSRAQTVAAGTSRQIQWFARQCQGGMDITTRSAIRQVKRVGGTDEQVQQIETAYDAQTKRLRDSTADEVGRIMAALGS